MTVGVGLGCDNGRGFLLAADTLLTYGVGSSNLGGIKLYESKTGLYAVVSGDVSWAHTVITRFTSSSQKLDPSLDSYPGDLQHALREASKEAFLFWREEQLRDSANVTVEEYLSGRLSGKKARDAKLALETAEHKDLPFQAIVVGFVSKDEKINHRIMLYADHRHVGNIDTPGVFCIGSGSGPALDWLNFRQQNISLPWEISYYHLVEALKFSELSVHVGSKKAIVYLSSYQDGYVPIQGPNQLQNREMEAAIAEAMQNYGIRPTNFPEELRERICKAVGLQRRPRSF